jgi:hypothetical protein
MVDLQDAYLSVDAAEARFEAFLAGWDAAIKKVKGTKTVRVNDQGLHEHWIDYGAIVPPLLQTTLTEAIFHLRRSLDQATVAFWRKNSNQEPPRHLYFPICDRESDLEGKLSNPPLNNLGPQFAEVVRAIAPYPTKTDEGETPSLINALNAAAKESHRVVCRVHGHVTKLAISNGLLVNLITPVGYHRWVAETNSMHVGTTTPDGIIEANIEVGLTPIFGGIPTLEGAPIAPNVAAMGAVCRRMLDGFSK